MRNVDAYLGSVLWVAVATLLPMAALEPVVSEAAAPPAAYIVAFDGCDQGANLAMGCAEMSL